jgi:hypothetical protein
VQASEFFCDNSSEPISYAWYRYAWVPEYGISSFKYKVKSGTTITCNYSFAQVFLVSIPRREEAHNQFDLTFHIRISRAQPDL